jgi:hypothetical protein
LAGQESGCSCLGKRKAAELHEVTPLQGPGFS